MLANVKIKQDKENKHIHRVFIDGKQIEKITHLDFQVNPSEIPSVTLNIEQMSGIDFEGQAEVNFLNDPFTVQNACKIIQEELLKHGDLHRAFSASIESSLKEQKVTALPFQPESDIADKILQRIIGEDEPDERKD